MPSKNYDLIVVGAGPGGEVGAIRAAQLGLKVAIVDKREHLGGTCLNVGCIPTKSLLESAKLWTKLNKVNDLGFQTGEISFDWKKILAQKLKIVEAQRKGLLYLMKKNRIDVYKGLASFKDSQTLNIINGDNSEELKTNNVLIATGSKVKELPFVKSNGKTIHSSDTVLDIDAIPATLAIIGGGVVGMEFASLFGQFGSKVTVIEMLPKILPFEDAETVKELSRCLRKQGVSIETKTKLISIESSDDSSVVKVEGNEGRNFERVLIAIGREPVTEGLALDNIKVKTENGFIPVDCHYKTSCDGVFAIGDVINTPALAHTASAEAIHAVEIIAGHSPVVIDYLTNPSAIYTYPEIASIGKTETTLKEEGTEFKIAKFPFSPLAKAKIEGGTEGFIKIIYGASHRELLGVHIVGAKATDLIGEFVLGKILETTVDEIAQSIHPHPTISETIMETAHVAMGGAIHL